MGKNKLTYKPKPSMVTIRGFDELTSENYDVLDTIADPKDLDNKRGLVFRKKKKSSKSKSKRKISKKESCGCK